MTTNKLDVLLGRISDPRLRNELTAEVGALRETKRFGLIFEEHLPETVRLPKSKIRRGLLVQHRDTADGPMWTVAGVKDGYATLVDGDGVETVEAAADLVVVRTFGQPIHPGLCVLEQIHRGPAEAPHHLVINAENHHALEMLRFTHAGAVDLIYIDPPYNTGNEFVYNDKRVGADDAFRHSKWLSFMDRRLRLARPLLKPTGVIMVAIGDDEHAHLRILMDQVFGAANFISDVVWQGGRKNDSRYVSNGADYMLIYARDESALQDAGVRWREKKPGVDEALAMAARIWNDTGGDHPEATRRWRAWLKDFKRGGTSSDAVTRFVTLDAVGRPIRTDGNVISPNPRPNLQYDLPHPVTGLPVRMHPNGWRYSRETMAELIGRGLIYFGPDHTTGAGGVVYLDSMDMQVAESVFVRDRNPSGGHLRDVLGGARFQNPKDHNVLMRWIRLVTESIERPIVLDFFAGSGSTTEAVMCLNAEDGGSRQSIVVTNNEVDVKTANALVKKGLRPGDDEWEAAGIFHHVTKPRVATVVTGTREDGSRYSEGLEVNVTFAEMTYEDRDRVTLGRAYAAVAPLLWAKAGSVGPIIDTPTEGFACPDRAVYAVLFEPGEWAGLVHHLAAHPEVRTVFVVTDSDAAYRQVTSELPTGLAVHRLYADYLTNFEINTGAGGTL